uniref:Centlein n=1 Tax=Taeniopygia guttata TaxID=59729 RepID=A0A674HUJ4_TAEGU
VQVRSLSISGCDGKRDPSPFSLLHYNFTLFLPVKGIIHVMYFFFFFFFFFPPISKADKEFVWSLWKNLQVSKSDLTQTVSLVVERENQKAEVKDRSILEILHAKDRKMEHVSLEHQEINSLMQRKSAVDEENARLKNEFCNLNRKFKDKSQELKDTKECAQKKEEQNRLVIKNLEEEKKGLNICCADLLSDLEKLRKQEAQWKKTKSGNNIRIKAIDRKINEDRKLLIYNKIICIQILTEIIVLFLDFSLFLVFNRKELEEIQNLCRQNIEDRTQQAELIKQLEALNADTQKVLQDQEYAHTAKTTYQKVCYSIVIKL